MARKFLGFVPRGHTDRELDLLLDEMLDKMGVTEESTSFEVRVTLFADLRKYLSPGQQGSRRCRLAVGATVADLVAELGIPPGELMTVGVNGELAASDTVLGDGDDVALFSPMEGG